jgi:hypothetical protein
VTDRRRRLVPDRLLLPPPPRDDDAARRWRSRPFDERRRLALASTRGLDEVSGEDRDLVRALARARVVTGWRLQVAALVFAWLVLMTVWGFGRSTFHGSEPTWRAIGLGAAVLAWVPAAATARHRVRRARRVAEG